MFSCFKKKKKKTKGKAPLQVPRSQSDVASGSNQISEIVVPGQPEDITSKEALKIWGQRTVEGYPGVKIRNFTNSWRDGKAFLAIIHRNRPDLIDISRTRHNNNRQNLELAFGTAERELAVTRLLDPEDVDVNEPDEKSIITYVSSLYDVFPEVPSVEQTLRDNERQIKQEEYRDLASSLCMWLKEATNIMMDKTFPTTLIEMRSVLAECKRFRTEDIPPRQDTKQKLLRIYDEIQGLGPGTGDMGIPDELHPDNINRLWSRFTFAQQERDSLVQSEVVRLERLQRLAEKLHRDCKYQEDKLDEVAIGVYEEQGRVDVVHPHEAKRKCDALDEALRNVEENARSMFRDVQALQDGRFSTAEQLSRRVSSIKSRVSQLRTQLFGEVVQKLISKSYVEEGVTVTRRREYVTEIRPTDMNPTFQHVHECLSWVENKQAELESREYGTDLSTVETLCSSHQLEHQQIQNFRREIEKCISDGRMLSPEDQNLYAEWLSKVEVAYSLLIKTSTRRSRSLDSLREFLQTAMQELIWLNDKEEQQVTREININTDPQTTDGAYKSLIHELELREVQFNSVQERGTALVLDRHPAADTIKAYMEEMQSQWSLLLQLTLCLESHVKSITTYHQFFQECRQYGSEMTHCSELLNTIYGQENLSIDDAKRQISDLHKMQEQLTEFDKQIANLIQTSEEVIPLEKRTEHVSSESTVQCLCTYRHQKEIIQRGQEYELLDTSNRTKWKVALSNGDEEMLPSICFVIPPPNKDAISQAERLHVQFEHLHSLWKMRQRSTKHNMILNTVRVIKNWDLKQFMSLEPGRREMFWRTVNEDAEKLITEVGETTHEMRKLRGELAECNQIFLSLSATAQEEESHKTKSPDQKLVHEVDSFNKRFMDCEQELMSRLQDHLPRDKLGLRHIVEQQKVWEANASELENGVDVLKSTYASLPHKSHIAESKYHAVVQRWDQIRSLSRVYLDRLKATDSLLTGIEQMRQLVADYEIALVSHDNMSADPDTFRQVHEELQDLDSSIQQQQPKLDRLTKDVENLRALLKHCRPGTSRHNDLETVDKEVDGLRQRWEQIILQIVERRRVFESSSNLLSLYTSGVKDEQQWMKRLQMKINQLPPLTNNIEEVQQQIEPSMAIYNGLGEHQHQLEAVNKYGGQFIREAKGRLVDSYDKLGQDLNNELNWLSDVEQLLRDDHPISDDLDKVKGQLQAQKDLISDIQQHQQPIAALIYQTEQLLENHEEELTPEQVTELQNLTSNLKSNFGKCQKTSSTRLKHLTTASDELTKHEAEHEKFLEWVVTTDNDLRALEIEARNLDSIKQVTDKQMKMMNDIISHQADTRFLTMTVQKYMEESKLHKLEVDAFKANRRKTSRLSWIGMEGMDAETVAERLKDTTTRYDEVQLRCRSFGDKLSSVSAKQREFNDGTFKLLSWLTGTEEKLSDLRQEPGSVDSDNFQNQMEMMKSLSSDAIAHKSQLEELEKSSRELIADLHSLSIETSDIDGLQEIISDISDRQEEVVAEIHERTNNLQTALTKSQNVEDALDNMLTWLRDTEGALNNQRRASLSRYNLNEQCQNLDLIKADIDSHKPSIEAIRNEANELIKTCELDTAKSIEAKIGNLEAHFHTVQDKCKTRNQDLQELSETLEEFHDTLDKCKHWIAGNTTTLEDREWNKKPVETVKDIVEKVSAEKVDKQKIIDELRSLGQALIEDSRTGEVGAVKESLNDLDRRWHDMVALLSEREQETLEKDRQGSEYETMKKNVVDWLTKVENKVDGFQPVAVDVDIAENQIEELQPMLQQYTEYAETVDEVNDLGAAYDNLQNPDTRPSSPFRKIMRGRRLSSLMSPRVRSPSPSFTYPSSSSPNVISPASDSSGFSSKKSSSDNFNLEDLTEIQQELVDINHRYDLLGDRLSDRHQELQNMLSSTKTFLQDVNDLMTWVDLKELDASLSPSLPTSEREAKKQLKLQETLHKELLEKEALIEDIRNKSQELMKTKKGVPGMDRVQQQFAELDDKWLDVKVASEQRRKALEGMVSDIRDFKDAGVHLQKWIAQKEKMVAVLGPVATEPSQIHNQQEQIKILKEEIAGQEPLYERLIQSGHSILDKCQPDSTDAAHISEKMAVISKGWDQLSSRLGERDKTLIAVEGMSAEFNETLQSLHDWLGDYTDRVDGVNTQPTNPEEHQRQIHRLQSLEGELVNQQPLLNKLKELGKKVGDNTKDLSTKSELKNKISAIEKPVTEMESILAAKKTSIEQSSQEGEQFKEGCQEILDWVSDLRAKIQEQPPVSGNLDLLREQARQQKLITQDINERGTEVRDILRKGNKLLDTMPPSKHSNELAEKLEDIKTEWEELNRQALQRSQQIEASQKHGQNFQEQLDKILMWLNIDNEKLANIVPKSLDKDVVAKKLKDAQALQTDILKHSHDHDNLNREGQSLIGLVDTDKNHVTDTLFDANKRWENLSQAVADKIEELEDLLQRLEEFQDNMRESESTLDRYKDKLDTHLKQGSSSKDPKHIDKIKAWQEDVDAITSQVDYAEALLDGLQVQGDITAPLVTNLEKAKQKHDQLQQELADVVEEMESGAMVLTQYQDLVQNVGSELAHLDAEFTSLDPIGRDESMLRGQQRENEDLVVEIEEFISKLHDIEAKIDDVKRKTDSLKSSGYLTDTGVLSPMKQIQKQFDNLKDKAEKRKEDLAQTFRKMEGVDDNLRRMRTSIDRASAELDMHEPIGHDVEPIKRQQEELKLFQKSVLEPLLKRVESVQGDAQILVQTSAPGVNTGGLESDLEIMVDKWSELNEKVLEREHNLDNALLQAGKFNDALDSLLSWLKETEDMVQNQKSPSTDYKVVKAQLQEQKFLMKMLDDRESSVKSAKQLADNLLKNLDSREQKAIQNQSAQLQQRWDVLRQNAANRLDKLEDVVGLARDYQEVRDPLCQWLDMTEKKFAALEPSAMDTEGIENIITSLKDMEDDIDNQEYNFTNLGDKSDNLQKYCSGPDADTLDKKTKAFQSRFSDLRNKVSDSTEQMEEALPLAKNFNVAHAKFLDWVLSVEPQLRAKEATGPEAFEQVQNFVQQLQEIQAVIETLNNDGNLLAELAPGDAGLRVEDTINKNMKRYDAVNDNIQRRSQKLRSTKQRSSEIVNDMNDLIEWFDDEAKKIKSAEDVSSDPVKLNKQIAEQKAINDDISSQKAKAREFITKGKKLLRESSFEDDPQLRERVEHLKQKVDAVGKLGVDRLSQLEQTLPLAKAFYDTHQDLITWFAEVNPTLAELDIMSIDADHVKRQQDQVKVLKQEVQDHKPVIDRLNKTGNALVKLCGAHDCLKVQKMLDKDNKKLDDMRNSLRDRSMSIDEALQQSAEFTDKLEDMLETLATTSEQVENAEPVSAHPDKLREQLAENKALLEDMDMRQTALQSIKSTAEDLINQAGSDQDEAVKDVQQKLNELIDLYEGIKDATHSRTQALEETLDVSERFWDDLHSLAGTIKDLQNAIVHQDPPALEPAIIREQQDYMEALKDDIEATQADIEDVSQTGDQLVSLCGDPERPEVEKNVNDLQLTLGNVADKFEKRSKDLEVALTKAVHFQDELMKILVWLQKNEVKVREFGHVGTDFDTIKIQWNQVKDMKAKIEPKQVDVEALNQKANDLAKDSTPEQAAIVKEPMSSVNKRWDNLLEGLGDRERKLQMAMLNVGQFEHALNELLAWLDKTDQSLDDATSVNGDHKSIEIELAKLKVIQNDVDGHKESVDSLKEAGVRVVAKEHGTDSPVKRKLNEINTMWGRVQDKCNNKHKRLKDALREAKSFAGDLQDTLAHMSELEDNLITSTPVGGLPETAKEQFEKFMHVYNELDNTDRRIGKLTEAGNKLAAKKSDTAANSIRQSLGILHQRWENIRTRAEDRKAKLESAVGQANSFSDDLNRFIAWLTDTEKTLNNLKPVSRLLDRIAVQIEDHKALQKDVSKNRETMIALDKTGTHLKYFSQKQDVILIKNLLASVQHRWEKIVSRSAERTRHLEKGYKEAKQFHAMWRELLDWLREAEKTLDSHHQVGNDPIKIKAEIAKHKEYQRGIGTRQPLYDSINRSGRTLKDKCPPEDVTDIQRMLIELKTKWNTVCSKSVDRQRQLEEALLFAGQFSEALQALLDWLGKVEPTLGEDQPVHGDIDTVNNLMESHKAYQQELGARANTVEFVRKRAKELMDKSEGDMSQQQAELIELSTLWDRVCKLSVNKQERLEQAHKLAEEFHKKAQGLLEWLASAERQLRYRGPIPDEEPSLIKHIEEHKKFEEELMRQEAHLRETLNIGQDIMKRCHPDALSTLKHWLSALKARWEELTGMCKTRGKKMAENLSNVRSNTRLLDDLLAWLNGAETTLINVDQEPIPGDIQVIHDLIKDHQHFMNEVSSRQPDVDRLIKADKQRTASTSEPASYIPVLRNTSGRHTPVKLTSRKDNDSGRRTPEPSFRNPRTGALFNKWRGVWLMTMDRQRKLQDALDHLNEVEKLKNFSFDPWRKRFLQWMRHNKSRIMEMFRRIDRDKDGRITRKEFIDAIISTKFPTSQLEMDIVANLFDRDGSGLIDYKEFVSALRPDTHKELDKNLTDSEKIHDEVHEQVSKCTCVKQFRIHKIGEGKYRFGDSQKLRLVRILRSTVMVRVGGGWVALDEFLVKNDPCRAKGRTNIELREQFILAQGVSQSMTGFTAKSPSGSSYSGSSTHSAGTWSTRSPSSATGPITKIREKTQYPTPWRQRMKNSPDVEVRQIMSGDRMSKPKVSRDIMKSPATPVSRSSSRASTSSRPPSRADSEASEASEPEIFTTVQQETKNQGGRNTTTMTYQTHVIQTRRTSTPTSASKKVSKIPKPSPARKK